MKTKKRQKRLVKATWTLPQSKERTSPCAAKCRHRWCAGYNAGYEDGEVDAQEEIKRTPRR